MKKKSSKSIISGREVTFLLAGTAVGSFITFFFDPVRGNYRQALLRDKMVSFRRDANLYGGRFYRDLKNRSLGVKAKTKKVISGEGPIRDDVLEARVRSKFGRIVSHPRAIQVIAHDGVVTLSGAILKSEVKELVKCVRKVAGVRDVENGLDVYLSSEGISQLQGKGPEYLQS